MSSQQPEKINNQHRLHKKRKTAENGNGVLLAASSQDDAGVPTAAAAAADDAVDPAQAFMYNRIMEDIAKKYVTKKEHEDLKTQYDDLKTQHDHLKTRLDNFTETLAPATFHALFETAIYEFVDKSDERITTTEWQGYADKIKYSVSLVCAAILTYCLFPVEEKNFSVSWQKIPGRFVPISMQRVCVLHGIAGLVAFVQSQEEDLFFKWDPEARNKFSHDGNYLNSVYLTPKKERSVDQPSFSETKQQVKKLRSIYLDNASSVNIPTGFDDAVSWVCMALEGKGVPVQEKVKQEIIKVLKEVFDSNWIFVTQDRI